MKRNGVLSWVVTVFLALFVHNLSGHFTAGNAEDRRGVSNQKLFQAAERGDVAGLRAALMGGAEVNCCAEQGNGTPLVRATFHRRPEAVRLLLDAGADVNMKSMQGGQTALHIAVGLGNLPESLAVAEILLDKGADLTIKDHNDNPPWFGAYNVKKFEFAAYRPMRQLLFKYTQKRPPQGSADETGRPLEKKRVRTMYQGLLDNNMSAFASSRDPEDLDEIRYAVAAGADVNCCAHRGSGTPLMTAAFSGNVEALKLLLELGADPNIQSTQGGGTALHWAAQVCDSAKSREVAKILLGKGADLNIRDSKGRTVLEIASQDLKSKGPRCKDFHAILLEHGPK